MEPTNPDDDANVARLRRFALIVSLILLVYSLAGGRLLKTGRISFTLGFAIDFSRPYILEWGLVLLSIYAMCRYAYFALIKTLTPWDAREQLQVGQFGPIWTPPYNAGPAIQVIASRYVPGMENNTSVVRRLNAEYGYVGVSGAGQYPLRVRLWIWLDNLDYTAPIWLNAIAVLVYIITVVCFRSSEVPPAILVLPPM